MSVDAGADAAPPLMIVAGEASGDLHGARLLTALRARRPALRAVGLGGDELRAAGLETVADSAEISVVGIVEVLKIYRRAKQIFDQLVETA
ncbi:MAG: lipid-A-disaccharide synthase, partial [Acidobacteriota bacterium]